MKTIIIKNTYAAELSEKVKKPTKDILYINPARSHQPIKDNQKSIISHLRPFIMSNDFLISSEALISGSSATM